LEQNPQHPAAILNLAILAQQQLNNRDLAKKYYQDYLKLNPRPANADEVQRILAELEPSVAAVRQALAGTNGPVNTRANEGRSLIAEKSGAGTSSSANYRYRRPAKPRPGNRFVAEPYFRAGVTAQGNTRFKEAMTAYQRAVQADPAYYEAYFNMGLAAYQAEDWPASLSAYELALVLRPDSVDARYNFALALKRAGYPAQAAEQLKRLLETQPKEARAYLSLGNLYAQPLDDAKAARAHYEKFLELSPDNAEGPRIREWLSTHGN
jgi:tetratricopeptide (TPR) repeat protein